MLMLAGFLDQSFILPGNDRGVLEHPGAWGIIFGDLLVFFAASTIVNQLNKIPRKFPARRTNLSIRYLLISRRRLLNAIFLRSKYRIIFLYAMLASLMFWLNNAYQTTQTVRFYGNELFDSYTFIYGYVAMRIILFISWVIFTPYIAYISICASFTIYNTMKSLDKKHLLQFSLFHPDGCGGFSYLGNINVAFVFGMAVVYIELTIVLFTHHKLNPGLASGFVLATIFFVGSSYIMLVPAHAFLLREKKMCDLRIFKNVGSTEHYQSAILSQHIKVGVSFNPYHAPQRTFLAVARIAPIAASSVRLYLLQFSG